MTKILVTYFPLRPLGLCKYGGGVGGGGFLITFWELDFAITQGILSMRLTLMLVYCFACAYSVPLDEEMVIAEIDTGTTDALEMSENVLDVVQCAWAEKISLVLGPPKVLRCIMCF